MYANCDHASLVGLTGLPLSCSIDLISVASMVAKQGCTVSIQRAVEASFLPRTRLAIHNNGILTIQVVQAKLYGKSLQVPSNDIMIHYRCKCITLG